MSVESDMKFFSGRILGGIKFEFVRMKTTLTKEMVLGKGNLVDCLGSQFINSLDQEDDNLYGFKNLAVHCNIQRSKERSAKRI